MALLSPSFVSHLSTIAHVRTKCNFSNIKPIDTLRVMKQYRTPQALRSFARLFSVFLPPFYAPYYGQLAYDLNSLPMAIIFASVTSIALTSLFESIYQMEGKATKICILRGEVVAQS